MNENELHKSPPLMTKEDFVYSRIGMALVSAQRVEYLTGQLLELLVEFDKDVYGITTSEFLEKSAKSKSAFKTLGAIFTLLKLNPKLVIEDELNGYLKKRNLFVHKFWITYLSGISDNKAKEGVDFCYDFGQHSDRISSFFKGFIYFLALRHVKERDDLDSRIKQWDRDFEYFMTSSQQKTLAQIESATNET